MRSLIVTTFGRPGYVRRALEAGASAASSSRTPRPASSPTPYDGCTPACGSSTRTLAAESLIDGPSPLTGRERELLTHALDGSPVSTIAARVHLSEGTVRNHLSAAIGKTGATTRSEAARIAQERGWL